MENETIGHEFSITEIGNTIDKIVKELNKFDKFEYETLLKEKTSRFVSDFKIKNEEFNQSHTKEPYNLRLRFRTEPILEVVPSELENQTKSIKPTISPPDIFLYSFELPCKYENYVEMIRNEKIQTKLDEMICSYEIREEIGHNELIKAEIVELSYKRVLIISPREFLYMRIFFKDNVSDEDPNKIVYWIVTFSIPYEKKTDKTTAEIILTVQKIEENLEKNKLEIKVYSEVDMKTAVKPDMARNKGFAEIKKYVQKLYEYSKTMN